MINEQVVRNLNYFLRTYDGQVDLIKKTKQRILSLSPESDPEQQDEVKLMESLKGKLSRQIVKHLEFFPVWTEWLEKVPGAGPYIAGNLIILYYFRFEPVCPKCEGSIEKQQVQTEDGKDINGFVCTTCGHKLKGDGLLKHKVGHKDFPTISKWWKYMGREIIDGKMAKRSKGVVSDWSSLGRVIGYQFGDQVNRQKESNPYKAFLLERKARKEKTHPDASKGHKHNMARHETIKLFLAHFWQVARTLDGKPVSDAYAGTILGHTNIIQPFYFIGK